MKRALIVGLDGATFDVIQPLVEQGRLPNLARMMREGAWGPLRSTVPPISPTAWTTFATGVGPGVHGVYDFVRFRPGTTERVPVPAGKHGRATLWRLFSRADRRVVVLDVPFTHPPEPVDGVMITGYGTPRTPGTVYTHPADLPQRLDAAGLPSGLGWPEERMDVRPEYLDLGSR